MCRHMPGLVAQQSEQARPLTLTPGSIGGWEEQRACVNACTHGLPLCWHFLLDGSVVFLLILSSPILLLCLSLYSAVILVMSVLPEFMNSGVGLTVLDSPFSWYHGFIWNIFNYLELIGINAWSESRPWDMFLGWKIQKQTKIMLIISLSVE